MGQSTRILLYDPKGEVTDQIKILCALQRIKVRAVTFEETAQTVGRLAGLDGYGKTEKMSPQAIADPVMILCDLTDAALNRLLQDMRKKKISLPYKAVLTETNAGWPLFELYEELKAEHEAMQQRNS